MNEQSFYFQHQSLEQLLREIQKADAQQMKSQFLKFDYLKMQDLKIEKVKHMHNLITQRSISEQNRHCWQQNEKKLFIWLLLSLKHTSLSFEKQLQQLSVCLYKDINLVRFEAANLLTPNTRKHWEQEEDLLLTKIIQDQKKQIKGEWLPISKGLYTVSNFRYLRTSKQCRERWLNHLDPNKDKKWTPQLDLILLKGVKNKGRKWALIAQDLQGKKNQHMVKNRYNSLKNKMRKKYKTKDEKQILKLLMQQSLNKANNVKQIIEVKKQPRKNGGVQIIEMDIINKQFDKIEQINKESEKKDMRQDKMSVSTNIGDEIKLIESTIFQKSQNLWEQLERSNDIKKLSSLFTEKQVDSLNQSPFREIFASSPIGAAYGQTFTLLFKRQNSNDSFESSFLQSSKLFNDVNCKNK